MEIYPNLKEEVDNSVPGCEISSLLGIFLPCGQLPRVLWLWPVGLLSQQINEYNIIKIYFDLLHNIQFKFTMVNSLALGN